MNRYEPLLAGEQQTPQQEPWDTAKCTREEWEAEIRLETEMSDLGVARYRKHLQSRKDHTNEGDTKYGQDLMSVAFAKVAFALAEWKKALPGTARRRGIAIKYLATFDDGVASFIALKSVLDSISLGRSLTNAALQVGSRLEDEARFLAFEQAQPLLYKHIEKSLQDTSSYHFRRHAMIRRMEAYHIPFEEWPHDDKLHTGMKMLDLILQVTGLFTINGGTQAGKKKVKYTFEATPETMKWISDYNNFWEVLDPILLTTVIPPKKWNDVWSGGYWSEAIKPLRLVKKRAKPYLQSISETDLSKVFEAINTLQDVPWEVNPKVLEVARKAWELGWTRCELPQRYHDPMPTKPLDIATNEDSRRTWKHAARKVYADNATRASKCIQTAKILWLGERYSSLPKFYFPYQLDFRGRAYATPMFLQPQGCDLARGCLRFHAGKPLGDETAAHWLAIHGANLYGQDKVALSDRAMWVLDNEAKILACAQDPLTNLWWTEADDGSKAWQFLAFCFEWEGYVTNGVGHVTHLPIALDGSCNGIQHFSAMLRDPVGGHATNLSPSPLPQDIYAEVAKAVIARLTLELETNPYAKGWLEWGITRKITKRPVMVLPYGGTRFSCAAYVQEAVREATVKGKPHSFGKQLPQASRYLARIVWESIGKVVVAAVEAMGWLRKVAKAYNDTDIPIVWTAPNGFTVFQRYEASADQQIKLHLGGKRIQQRRSVAREGIDYKAQVNGISPNFVHSLDAAAMGECIIRCKAKGITNLAMIHDSYGTLAPDTGELGATLRDAFTEMYTTHDPLKALHKECKERTGQDIPLPPMGTLDITGITESDFFFA